MLQRRLENGRLVWPSDARRILREHLRRISQAELARQLHVSQSEVARWASGWTRPSTPEAFVALERVVGISLSAWTVESMQPCIRESDKVNQSAATAAQ